MARPLREELFVRLPLHVYKGEDEIVLDKVYISVCDEQPSHFITFYIFLSDRGTPGRVYGVCRETIKVPSSINTMQQSSAGPLRLYGLHKS